jgi:hypothetical protein
MSNRRLKYSKMLAAGTSSIGAVLNDNTIDEDLTGVFGYLGGIAYGL